VSGCERTARQARMPAPLRRKTSRPGESGFALLFVFALAAALAFMLYMELPRVAFEAQRDREEMLIQRGEQYQRAIQLYIRKFNKYPASLDDLEKTQNVRFLRKRYKDPMTGKAEWRLIHAGPGGVLVDSVTQKPPSVDKDQEKTQSAEASATEVPGLGTPGQPVQPGMRRRPSDGVVAAGGETQPGQFVPTDPQSPVAGQPSGYPQPPAAFPQALGQPGYVYVQGQPGQQPNPYPQAQPGQQPVIYPPAQPGQSPQPGQPPYGYPQSQPGQPASGYPPPPGQSPFYPVPTQQTYPQFQPREMAPYPTQNIPGLPGPYGARQAGSAVPVPVIGPPASSQTGGVSPTPYPYSTQPGVSGAPGTGQPLIQQPGYQPAPGGGAPQNPALEMIRNLLTNPRPGGLTGVQAQSASGGQIMGGGIAGVASTAEAEGIKLYNERSKYNEWEFIYDIRKDPLKLRQMGIGPTQPGPAGTLPTPSGGRK